MTLCSGKFAYLMPWCTLCRRYLMPWYYCIIMHQTCLFGFKNVCIDIGVSLRHSNKYWFLVHQEKEQTIGSDQHAFT